MGRERIAQDLYSGPETEGVNVLVDDATQGVQCGIEIREVEITQERIQLRWMCVFRRFKDRSSRIGWGLRWSGCRNVSRNRVCTFAADHEGKCGDESEEITDVLVWYVMEEIIGVLKLISQLRTSYTPGFLKQICCVHSFFCKKKVNML